MVDVRTYGSSMTRYLDLTKTCILFDTPNGRLYMVHALIAFFDNFLAGNHTENVPPKARPRYPPIPYDATYVFPILSISSV